MSASTSQLAVKIGYTKMNLGGRNAILKERLPEFDISSIQLGLILDMITLNVDENRCV